MFGILLNVTTLYAQINTNMFFEKNMRDASWLPGETETSYRMYPLYSKLDTSAKLIYGFDLTSVYQNSALTPYQAYNDPVHYLVSPFGHLKFSNHIMMDVRGNIENKKTDLVYEQRPFWSDELAGHRGGFEVAKITYDSDNFFVKFGRDYFLQGNYFYENLLFSRYNYPYDQLYFGFKNDYFELSSYYLALNSLREGGSVYLRHLNGHRLSINLKIGYLAFNEVILYGGENRQMNIVLLNPLIIYYSYQKNNKNFESNSLVSAELYLNYHKYFIYGEFLLDDFQIDNKVPGDLEPTEWGMNVTLGKNSIINDFNGKINYTRVANRTYNAPLKDYEKYLYKNYPIGHFLGNNFWELQASLAYVPNNISSIEIQFSHIEFGKESLYGPFNTDYLNYTVEQGYSESFPFGSVDVLTGMQVSGWLSLFKNLLFKANMNYWFDNQSLEKDFTYSVGLAYRLSN